MATFEVAEGPPGQGKSLYSARKARELIKRNMKWHAKGGLLRKYVSNQKFSKEFEDWAGDFLGYWTSPSEIMKLRNVDLGWDEIATELDSRRWAMLDEEFTRFLSQYRKRGVDIYANTQDFSMVDSRARLMCTKVVALSKAIGSPDPSATKPEVKNPWGLIFVWNVLNYKKIDPNNPVKQVSFLPDWFFIRKRDVFAYDTTQDIPRGEPAPLRHVVRKCEFYDDPNHKCSFCKEYHL